MVEQLTRPHLTDTQFQRRSRFVCLAAAILAMFSYHASSQTLPTPRPTNASRDRLSFESICRPHPQDSAKAALRLACQEAPPASAPALPSLTIVIGFLGGFANPRDVKHPEVLFAAFLRQHYAPGLHAQLFSNHDRNGALHYVLNLLDADRDGVLSDEEKKSARIIIYGHSWGASETVAFATTLSHYSIPVLLTIQMDTVGKWGQRPSRIPSNVESAINFYQSEGLLRGQPKIVAADTTQTKIIGNFRSTYIDRPINCDNYPWLARTFNKPHHEIENDPGVWDRIASVIGSLMARSTGAKDPAAKIDPNGNKLVPPGTSQPAPVTEDAQAYR
jgi:hypothetical protein